mmetsp:Transcript_88540/g.258821  ORF Transcript_88540/g.258821 Transcript_88540/m.258821 type:complete len:318 (-) Transcript_88540:132-1085(-)
MGGGAAQGAQDAPHALLRRIRHRLGTCEVEALRHPAILLSNLYSPRRPHVDSRHVGGPDAQVSQPLRDHHPPLGVREEAEDIHRHVVPEPRAGSGPLLVRPAATPASGRVVTEGTVFERLEGLHGPGWSLAPARGDVPERRPGEVHFEIGVAAVLDPDPAPVPLCGLPGPPRLHLARPHPCRTCVPSRRRPRPGNGGRRAAHGRPPRRRNRPRGRQGRRRRGPHRGGGDHLHGRAKEGVQHATSSGLLQECGARAAVKPGRSSQSRGEAQHKDQRPSQTAATPATAAAALLEVQASGIGTPGVVHALPKVILFTQEA